MIRGPETGSATQTRVSGRAVLNVFKAKLRMKLLEADSMPKSLLSKEEEMGANLTVTPLWEFG